jgi:hypothetical protein
MGMLTLFHGESGQAGTIVFGEMIANAITHIVLPENVKEPTDQFTRARIVCDARFIA